MVRWIIGQSIRFRGLVLIGAIAVLLLGITGVRGATVDALPEFTPVSVEVQTEALGLSAAEVEQLITVPLEADLLNGVAWLKTIRSESLPGLSSLDLVFDPGTDPLHARQVVQERITQAKALPNVSSPPTMLEPLSSASRVMMIGLTPKDVSLMDASVLARWTIKPRLMGVPGVANVAIWGQRDQQLQVQVDPQRLAANGVTLTQIMQTTGNAMWVSPLSFLEASTPGTGGFFDTSNQRLGIQHVSPIVAAPDLAQVTVEDTPGRILRLGEVANVVADHQPLIGDSANRKNPSLLLVVEKFPGASTLEVTRGLDAALDNLRPGLGGMQIDTGVFRPATYLEQAIGNVGVWLLIGAVLLLLCISLLLFAWRAALISVVAIVVSLAGGAAVLVATGATINMLTLAGLVVAVGLVVDDAVLDVSRIRQHLASQSDQPTRSRASIIADAAAAVRGSIVYATVITLLAVVPVFFLDDRSRAFYQPVVLAYLFTLLASMIVALTVTPALCVLLLSKERPARRGFAGLRRLLARYESALARLLRKPRRLLLVGLLVLLGGAGIVPLLHGSAAPAPKSPDLLIQFDGPPGTSLPEMNRITAQATDSLSTIPGVSGVGSQVGRAVLADQVVGTNSSQLWVKVGGNYDATVAAITSAMREFPGMTSSVLTYEKQRTSDILAGQPADLTVRVYGQDLDVLRSRAAEIQTMLEKVPGVVAPRIEPQVEQPTMLIEVDLAAANRVGIKPGDVRREAATLVNGTEVGSLYEGQKIFAVVVKGTPSSSHSVSSIRDLVLDVPGGGHVRLGDVAAVRVAPEPSVIKREDVSRRIDITASVAGRSVSAAQSDVAGRLKGISFPLEYHAAVLGDYADQQAAFWRVAGVSLAVAIGIFLLLQAACGSWSIAAGVFLALPLALVGAVLTVALGGGALSLGALLGFLLVLGIAVRGCVQLIRHYASLAGEGMVFGRALVLRGTRERLRPIVTTALATALFLLPALFLGDIAGLEVIRPMAAVTLGGLVTATLVNLFVVPALYLALGSHRTADETDELFSS